MSSPFFSVIIPTYNAERFIERTLNSVLHQTFTEFELIVVDDGSNDKTADILKRYADKDARIRIITTPNSGGPTVPTNIGITTARGAYIAFLDHDDEWKPHKLERMHDFFTENSEVEFLASNVEHINDKTTHVTPAKLHLKNGNLPKKDVLAGNYFNTFSMMCIKKSTLDRVGSLDTRLKMFADFDMVTRMMAHDVPYAFLPDILVTYHVHDHNTSSIRSSAQERINDLQHIISKYEKTLKKFPISYNNILNSIAGLHIYKGERKEAIKHLKQAIKIAPLHIWNYAKLITLLLGNGPTHLSKKIKNSVARIIK